MSDINYTYNATIRRANTDVVTGNGSAYKGIIHTSTIELAASASGSTVKVGRFPSNARISLHSDIYYDDLATSGSPTIDIGVGSVDSNITSDPDALNDGLNASSAASNARIVKDIANVGKQLWEYVNGQTSDPGGELDIYLSVKDAATNAAGTISTEIIYTID
jgi:hypothetical protein